MRKPRIKNAATKKSAKENAVEIVLTRVFENQPEPLGQGCKVTRD